MYSITLEKRVFKYLDSCPTKHKEQIKAKILSLKENPEPNDSKALKGYSPYLRVDSGEYRIVYRIEDMNIFVILVCKRNDDEVYRTFKRIY